jgi:hypothetical protein
MTKYPDSSRSFKLIAVAVLPTRFSGLLHSEDCVFTIKVGVNWQDCDDPEYYVVSALPLGGLASSSIYQGLLKIIIIIIHLGL